MRCYFVDAFADRVFEGNPAGVCVMESWPSDELMHSVAIENNLSATAFAVKEGEDYRLRWFVLTGEVDLCGHATLATAFTISNYIEPGTMNVAFNTLSGKLFVTRKQDLYEIDFPVFSLKQTTVTAKMEEAIGARPMEAWLGRDLVCVMENAEQIYQAKPDMQKVLELDGL